MTVESLETVDVEMKSADSPAEDSPEGEKVKESSDSACILDIRENIRSIEKGIAVKEIRFISRILRTISGARKKLNSNILINVVNSYYSTASPERSILLAYLAEDTMETDENVSGSSVTLKNKTKACPTIEVDIYLHLLVLLYLLKEKKLEKALSCANLLIAKSQIVSRRSLDILVAKCYYYIMMCYEYNGRLDEVRPFFHAKLRSATLRNDVEGQAVLINCLLRNYLFYRLYEQADKLVSKSVFPETAGNNEWARYLYYLGKIKAARLEYSTAHTNLVQALRKAPQSAAVGFRQAVQKLSVTVQLLLGDIPDRQTFRQASLRRALYPYFQLTQAVRLGDLKLFTKVLSEFHTQFENDETYTLIIRLRHNVIKTALRAIVGSYSKITPDNVATILGLDTSAEALCIISKAVRDGVVEAVYDYNNGCIRSKETVDLYCTAEPQIAFHQRTSFCLELHNQSVKAMRYPPKSYGKELESVEERREREQQDLELAKEMADDDDDFP